MYHSNCFLQLTAKGMLYLDRSTKCIIIMITGGKTFQVDFIQYKEYFKTFTCVYITCIVSVHCSEGFPGSWFLQISLHKLDTFIENLFIQTTEMVSTHIIIQG